MAFSPINSGLGVTSEFRAGGARFETLTKPEQPTLAQTLEDVGFSVSDKTLLSGLAEQETGYGEERCLPNLKGWGDLGLTPQQELEATVSTSIPRARDDWANNMQNADCRAIVDANKDGVVDDFEKYHADRVVDNELTRQYREVEDRAIAANIREGNVGGPEGQKKAEETDAAIRGKEAAATSTSGGSAAEKTPPSSGFASTSKPAGSNSSTSGTDKKK